MPTPPLQRRLAGNPETTDTSACKSTRLESQTVCFTRPSQQRDLVTGFTPPDSRTTKRHAFNSLDDGPYNSKHKRLRTGNQPLPASPPASLLCLRTPTPSSCLPRISDVLVEDQSYQEHGPTPHMCGDATSAVSISSPWGNTNRLSQTSSIPDLFDDSDLEQFMDKISEGLLTTTPRNLGNQNDTEETFSLTDFDEETMIELLNGASCKETQRPPSSVVRAYDCDSRSADEFDSNLQHSSPSSSVGLGILVKDDSPLEQDVDWGQVHERAQLPKANSTPSSQGTRTLQSIGCESTQLTSLSPMRRSSAAIKPSSPVPFATEMLLKPHKTFFHIHEMLSAKAEMFKNQPDAIFELFARVVYSSRENFYRKQHFQFRSLFKESPPYLNGILVG
ncbi:hypothetical protein BGZ61DRAFT_591132 [Ilyonectria robusta]|uniref:uncharacterized protein n=1 Tax=Ilyonectria robusta TaxID=1079257 RepID=UPI001E8E8211|nr:uncharacterized protein BGZ61DRAFT_591132 [Ilyonectria robusta]KAH8677135.1 hypothetical protein BGZ61DRAFT_591132 [Ilyonectria robusta]